MIYDFLRGGNLKFLGYEISIKKIKKPNPAIKPKLDLDLNLISELKKKGISNREIAKRLNVSEITIRRRLKEMIPENNEEI